MSGISPARGFSNVLFLHSRLTSTFELLLGRMSTLNTCFPVHKRCGLMIVGGGRSMCRSASWRYEQICTNSCRLKNVSRRVMRKQPVIKSCVAAMMGSPLRGVTRLRLMFINWNASVRASSVCGTCKFISSPSKSAL
ncbi:BZ3500_MvSof-1268-A1-R1_Chr7-3g09656 [Microbotryum saponariae]|uniref:BZ3500_MvSof-1268-A1-R1_Chr7-3g09656 protein n=1 Tax=Microbotryum saponariae TaxID=289078 RepID=A0A2X0LCA1_9BASI|nr:BZ3501_MvSof-1269-A2-R1_Chr7-2g09379 [Microbotryum saponariae]SDA02358.1 BZ3500_MvSof-1268-A1-R1_Chr7-3g09656 [Microbotryum saponariae]